MPGGEGTIFCYMEQIYQHWIWKNTDLSHLIRYRISQKKWKNLDFLKYRIKWIFFQKKWNRKMQYRIKWIWLLHTNYRGNLMDKIHKGTTLRNTLRNNRKGTTLRNGHLPNLQECWIEWVFKKVRILIAWLYCNHQCSVECFQHSDFQKILIIIRTNHSD